MLNGKKVLAIIPARGGSKRLPRKNVLPLCGKPLIVWSIEAAQQSSYIDKIMVSTDDAEIAKIAEQYGAEVPFIRPSKLASDVASTIDVIIHAVNYYKANGEKYDYVMILQPTSPLRSSRHISGAIKLLQEKKADAIISVCETEHSPLWANTLSESSSLELFLREEIKNKRSQDLPKYYRLNGAIYLINVINLLAEKTMFISNNIYAYKMNKKSSVDIDEDLDFLFAECILNSNIEVQV
ncbi:MAG: CMP-N,N'-diacetyllegionaminic acid synthase [Colwellia sp.]|jgi:CMP-N,N'-diacetyllegionaminic acid synthase